MVANLVPAENVVVLIGPRASIVSAKLVLETKVRRLGRVSIYIRMCPELTGVVRSVSTAGVHL